MTQPIDWTPEDEAMETELRRIVLEVAYGEYPKAAVRWHKEKTAALRKEIVELLREVREWYCVECRMVYPGPPQEGVKCVLCPKCGGRTVKFGGDTPMWKMRAEKAEGKLAEAEKVMDGMAEAIKARLALDDDRRFDGAAYDYSAYQLDASALAAYKTWKEG